MRARARAMRGAALIGLAPALLLAISAAAQKGPKKAPRPQNVVLIVVDTLRADHLGAYGYPRATSPALDALARRSVLFTDARSQASCTFPSVNSLLTSRPPEAFLKQPEGALGIPVGIPSLAEILAARGFRTVAVSASPIVRRTPSRFNPQGGFGRGFEVFDEACNWQPAECVNRRALPHLRPDPRPLFLYLHYLDPHPPYAPPPWHRRRFARAEASGAAVPAFIRQGDPNPIARFLYAGGPAPDLDEAGQRHLVDLYDEEIAYFDTQLAAFLGALERLGLSRDTLLVLAADHGEELLEHGHVKHCRTLYDTSIRTPLLLRIPGVAPAALAAGARNLDVVPTILDYLGTDRGTGPGNEGGSGREPEAARARGQSFAGRSLRPAIERRGLDVPGWASWASRSAPFQISTQGSLRAATRGRFKLILDLAAGHAWLYDLAADPGESRDVLAITAARQRRTVAALRDALRRHLAAAGGPGLGASAEAERRLRSLGYLE